MLQDPDNRVKGNTIKALMGYDEGAAKDLIVKLSKSTKEGRRASACFCLHVAEAEWVEEILLDMVKKEDSIDLLKTECELMAETWLYRKCWHFGQLARNSRSRERPLFQIRS